MLSRRYILNLVLLLLVIAVAVLAVKLEASLSADHHPTVDAESLWKPPDTSQLPASTQNQLIKYGRDLIANTAFYLGPRGRLAKISNGLNCQNCHLEAGTRLYGNCFATVAASYPKYRDRSGRVETIAFRINECMERSLDGKALDSTSKEMQAMIAYIKWVGKDVAPSTSPKGIAPIQIPLLDRAADPSAGRIVYIERCQRCHTADGSGLPGADSGSYVYPPLWGQNSYTVSAGMYRIARLAAFIKYNMPYLPVQSPPQLSDADAWDVAAFISSQQRPRKFFAYDWSKLNSKPVDYPFGPFADSFPAKQHKYGPFAEIEAFKKKHQ